jgi:transposase-like protein
MDAHTPEQALRREAIRRRLQGERPSDICRDLYRSDTWLAKWWTLYQRQPQTDFADRSRAPHPCPHQTLPAVEHAVLMRRQTLAAGQSPTPRYGLIGRRVIRADLERLGLTPLPSLAAQSGCRPRPCLLRPRLPLSSRWLTVSNGGSYGRQITQVETARPEAEGRRQGRERSRSKGQARQLPPSPAARSEGQEVARRLGAGVWHPFLLLGAIVLGRAKSSGHYRHWCSSFDLLKP